MLKWKASRCKNMHFEFTCCKLRDFARSWNWTKNWTKTSSQRLPNRSHGRPRVRFVWFWKVFGDAHFRMILGASKSRSPIWKSSNFWWICSPGGGTHPWGIGVSQCSPGPLFRLYNRYTKMYIYIYIYISTTKLPPADKKYEKKNRYENKSPCF